MWYRVANKFVYEYIVTDSIDGILYDCDDDHVICSVLFVHIVWKDSLALCCYRWKPIYC